MKKIYKIFITIFLIIQSSNALSNEPSFDIWLKSFKSYALKNGISEKTFDLSMSKVKFNPKVIEYDRFQPEFYEDTKTYIKKRSSDSKVKNAIKIYNEFGHNLGVVLSHIVNMIDPNIITIGGGLSKAFDCFKHSMLLSLEENSLTFNNKNTKIFQSEFGEKSAMLGACILIKNIAG